MLLTAVIFVFFTVVVGQIGADSYDDRLSRLEEKLEQQQKIIDTLKMSNDKLTEMVDKNNKSRDKRLLLPVNSTDAIKPTVAFYAYMTKKELNPSPHHTLVFDTEKVDIGGGYNHYTGMYTVPVDGVYAFSFSVRAYCHATAPTEIVKNGEVEGVIIAQEVANCENEMAAGFIVVIAVKGDEVFVRTHTTNGAQGQLYNDHWGRATFSGWLIGYN